MQANSQVIGRRITLRPNQIPVLTHFFVFLLVFLGSSGAGRMTAQELDFPHKTAKRVVFLGDSITFAGDYVAMVETQWRLEGWELEVINLGLPSENCTGLSEPDHPFPRPDVHERLKRCLKKTQPDVIFACYGMNDGIYHPFDQQRFQQFQQGIQKIIQAAEQQGAVLYLMTPPPFDPLPMRKKGKLVGKDGKQFAWFSIYENYDSEVMKPYTEWMLTLRPNQRVIDLRGPVLEFMADQRKTNPDFAMSGDGVHVNQAGHALLARTLLEALDLKPSFDPESQLYKAIKQRQAIYRDAWLSDIGHKRPKMKAGLSLQDAKQKTAPLTKTIQNLLSKSENEK